MVKAARRILITLVCIVALAVAGMFLLESQWARERLEDRLSQRLDGRNVEIGSLNIDWGWPLAVHLESISVANPDWAPHDRMLVIEALDVAVNPAALLTGQFELQRLGLTRPVVHLARREDGTSNWAALTGTDRQSAGGLGISPDIVRVDKGQLTYRDPNLQANLSASFHTRSGDGGSRELLVEAQGRFQGLPLELSGHGGAPSQALAGNEKNAYPITLQGHLGQLQARFDGRLRDVSQPASLEGQLDVSAPRAANLAKMLGRPALELPALELHGRVSHRDRQWTLQSATIELGEAQAQGAVSVALEGERPMIDAQLQFERLDLSHWSLFDDARQPPRADRQKAAGQSLPWDQRWAQQLTPLQNYDAQFDLAIDRLAYADTALSDVTLKGSLEQGTLTIQRLHATQGQPQGEASKQRELTVQGQVDIRDHTLTADLEAQLSRFGMGEALAPLGYGGLGTWNGRIGLRLPANVTAQGNRPAIDAQLDIDHLDLARMGVTQDGNQPTSREADEPGPDAAWDRQLAEGLEPLQHFNAQADLSIGRLSYGATQLHDVALQGSLEAGRLDISNLHLEQDQGTLTAQGELSIQPQTLGGNIDAQLSRFDLGEALAPLGNEDLGTLDGQLHARLEDGELVADDTSLDYRLPAQDLFLHINADSSNLAGSPAPGVRLQGHGRHNGKPFEYDLKVGPLLNLRNPDKPYPVRGRITSGQSELHVDGTIEKPLELGRIQASFGLSGPNPARLNALTGLNFPALPPYELQGRMRVSDDLVRLLDLDGTFGNSDISGDVRLRLGEPDMLWATLHSQRLDLDDLAPLVGSAPETGGAETASPVQRVRARQEAGRPGLFSDREWNFHGWSSMDAEVRYTADNVNAEYVPLSNVSLDLALENGVLTFDPLRMGLGGGIVVARLRLDASGYALAGNLDLSVRQVNLAPILRRAGLPDIASDSAGTLGGQGKVRFIGGSMDELMASLNGRLELAMSGGRLDMLLIEGVGLDVGEGLLATLADADKVPMRCAYTRLDAESGVAAVERFFISTVDSNITGAGEIDLDHERLELVFEAHPKDPSLLASDSPVRVQGPITDPRIEVVSRELIARGVLSALSALVAPPLAILPWLEPGLGEGAGAGCRQVLEQSRAGQAG